MKLVTKYIKEGYGINMSQLFFKILRSSLIIKFFHSANIYFIVPACYI